MKPEAEGHAPPRGGPPDPLEVAEALRDALADSAAKATRLASVLLHWSKLRKALKTALSSLEQLDLGTEEPR